VQAFLEEEEQLHRESLKIWAEQNTARSKAMSELIAPSLNRTAGVKNEALHTHDEGHHHDHTVFFDKRTESGILQERIVVGEIASGFVVVDDYQCVEVAVTSIETLETLNNKEVGR
jgi:hypothetical protein